MKIKKPENLIKNEKPDIWKQIELVLNNDILTLQEQDIAISKLQMFIVRDPSTKTIFLNENICNSIWDIINENNPDLEFFLLDKLNHVKSWKKLKSKLSLKQVLKTIVTIIVAALQTKERVSKNILMLHLTKFLYRLLKDNSTDENFVDSEFDEKAFNELFKKSISLNLYVSEIHVEGFNKDEKNVWRCIHFVIGELKTLGWLEESTTLSTRPISFESPVQSKPRAMNVICLKHSDLIINNSITLFLQEWPYLVPPKVSPNPVLNHSKLVSGQSCLVMSKELLFVFQSIANSEIRYDYKMYLEALINIQNVKMFEVHLKYEMSDTSTALIQDKIKFKENNYAVTFVYEQQQLKTIIQYLDQYNLNIETWIQIIIFKLNKNLIRTKSPEIKFQYLPIMDVIIKDLLTHIVRNCKSDSGTWVAILDDYGSVIKQLQNYLSNCNNTNSSGNNDNVCHLNTEYVDFLAKIKENFEKGIAIKNLISSIITVIDLFKKIPKSKLISFYNIFEAYPQKDSSILSLWFDSIINGYKQNSSFALDLINSNILNKSYIEASTNHSLNINLKFKEQIMKLYSNKKFYFAAKIGVNGRLIYQGFCPHPHSGELFRFSILKKHHITENGMTHLKCSLSYAFRNKFQTHKEHVKWVDSNQDFIALNCYQSIKSFVYFKAFEAAKNKQKIGIPLRIDQTASVLTIYGVLADCGYYKKITNFRVGKKTYSPYHELGTKFFKPLLIDVQEKWSLEILGIREHKEIKLQLIYVLNEILLPNVGNKSFLKAIIMPHSYNLTYKGIEDKLFEYINTVEPHPKWSVVKKDPWFSSLALRIWHTLNKTSLKVKRLRDILNKTQEAILKLIDQKPGSNDYFSTVLEHHDCTLMWDYKTKKYVQKSIWDSTVSYSKTYKILCNTEKSLINQNLRAFSPLLIHSIDGAIIRRTIYLCATKHNFTPNTIHDCAMAHPNDMDNLLNELKRSFFEVFKEDKFTNKQWLEIVWLKPTLEHLSKKNYLEETEISHVWEIWEKSWVSSLNTKSGFCETKLNSKEIFTSTHNYDYE